MMLRLAVTLAIFAVCYAQTPTRPKIPETFSSNGAYEVHERDRTFFGTFVLDRDHSKNMGVENATGKADDVTYHHESLERYDMGKRYTVRQNNTDEPRCQVEAVTGELPEFWNWLLNATFNGNETIHGVVYDSWQFQTAGVEIKLFVLPTQPNVPRFLRRRLGGTLDGFEFRTFSAAEPSAADFDVPKVCVG